MSTMSTIKFPGDTLAREIVDKAARVRMGDLSNLTTQDRSTLVAAINEIADKVFVDVDEEDAAKAVFINLGASTSEYSLAQLQAFIDEQRILIGDYIGIQLPLVEINDERALFTVTFEAQGTFWMVECAVNVEGEINHNIFIFPKIPVPDKDEAGYFLQADADSGARWIKSSATVEVDKSLSVSGMAADSAAVGNAINSIANISKVTEIDMSEWDNNSFTVTLLNGAIINFNVEFNSQGEPISITDDNGLTTVIQW